MGGQGHQGKAHQQHLSCLFNESWPGGQSRIDFGAWDTVYAGKSLEANTNIKDKKQNDLRNCQ